MFSQADEELESIVQYKCCYYVVSDEQGTSRHTSYRLVALCVVSHNQVCIQQSHFTFFLSDLFAFNSFPFYLFFSRTSFKLNSSLQELL